MTEKLNPGGLPTTRKQYTPAFKAVCVRQVSAGARQSDVARAQGISPAFWAAGSAKRWNKPCPAVPNGQKSSNCAPNSGAWKWSATF
ncbi:transposase [Hymenobacter sp. UYCo722]|uniref:transposase n=1 Tax=Hymenobacter sp. UYCo722 TaxID=3156335 RepID=UPI0033977BDD